MFEAYVSIAVDVLLVSAVLIVVVPFLLSYYARIVTIGVLEGFRFFKEKHSG